MRSAALLAAIAALAVTRTPLSEVTPLVTAVLTGIAAVLAAYATVHARRVPETDDDRLTECREENDHLSEQVRDQQQRLIAANDRELTHLATIVQLTDRVTQLEAANRRLRGKEPR